MAITITINGVDAQEALQELSVFATGLAGVKQVAATTESTVKPEAKASTTPTKPKKETPPVVTPEPETLPETLPEPESAPDESVKVEDVRALAKQKADEGKRAEVQAVLVDAGYKNLSSVKAADLPAIKAELEKL